MSKRVAMREAVSKRYWREADGRVVVRAWRSSGRSMAAFARQAGVGLQRLRYWSARLSPSASSRVRFHPVRVSDLTTAPATIEVHVGGCRVVAAAGVRVEDLRSVLAAVRETATC